MQKGDKWFLLFHLGIC
uniref:Uncharacterized protein n=1 Tax=Rhizophora mucronata TaxID=61149 RepID=A0A2P2QWT3_RHIMU